jgi:hypothetical protein
MANLEVMSGTGEKTQVHPMAECEVCGRVACECPRPLGECCECRVPIHEQDAWMVDSEGGHYCLKCWPGGEA